MVFMVQEIFVMKKGGTRDVMYVYPVQQKRRSTSDPDDEMRCDMMHVREGKIPVQMRDEEKGGGGSRLSDYESHGDGARVYHQDRCERGHEQR